MPLLLLLPLPPMPTLLLPGALLPPLLGRLHPCLHLRTEVNIRPLVPASTIDAETNSEHAPTLVPPLLLPPLLHLLPLLSLPLLPLLRLAPRLPLLSHRERVLIFRPPAHCAFFPLPSHLRQLQRL